MNAIEPHRQTDVAEIVDDVIARGDLSKLTPEQRVVHYHRVCQSLGMNHLTQPFMYITLNGKLQLYAKRDAADQLRKINGINIEIASHSVHEGLLSVHVRARDKSGRQDEDFGVVSIAGLRGEAAANAFLKAVTKAKRRVTLSISGLGFADESEVEDFPGAVPMPIAPLAPETKPDTGEIPNSDDYVERWLIALENAISAEDLAMKWNAERKLRGEIEWADPDQDVRLRAAVNKRIDELKKQPAETP